MNHENSCLGARFNSSLRQEQHDKYIGYLKANAGRAPLPYIEDPAVMSYYDQVLKEVAGLLSRCRTGFPGKDEVDSYLERLPEFSDMVSVLVHDHMARVSESDGMGKAVAEGALLAQKFINDLVIGDYKTRVKSQRHEVAKEFLSRHKLTERAVTGLAAIALATLTTKGVDYTLIKYFRDPITESGVIGFVPSWIIYSYLIRTPFRKGAREAVDIANKKIGSSIEGYSDSSMRGSIDDWRSPSAVGLLNPLLKDFLVTYQLGENNRSIEELVNEIISILIRSLNGDRYDSLGNRLRSFISG